LVKRLAKSSGVDLKKGDDLEAHISSLLNKPLSNTDCGTLQRVRNGCNPNSHDSEAADTPGIIRGYIGNLQQVNEAHPN
jgi:hypothetical protein